jgi:soluble lytic murein transglycosylase
MSFRPFVRAAAGIGAALPVTFAAALASLPDLPSLPGASTAEVLAAAGLDGAAESRLRPAADAADPPARRALLELLLRKGRVRDASALLDRWGGPASLPDDTALFTTARVREGAGDSTGALDAYRASSTGEPLLADHATFRAGLLLEALGRADEAVAAYETAADAARTRSLAAASAFRAATVALARGEGGRARTLLESIPMRSVVPRADRLDLDARIARAEADTAGERRALRALLETASSPPAALEAVDRLAALGPLSLEDRLLFAEAALAGGYPQGAEEHARAALDAVAPSRDPVLSGRARLLLGRALIARRELSAARAVLARMPSRARVADRAAARLEAARCLWKLGQIDACLAEYDAIRSAQLPESTRAVAAWEAAREAKDDGRAEEAARRFAEFRRAYPAHESAPEALWFRGRALADVGDLEGALAALAELQTAYPTSPRVEEAGYWAVRVHREASDEAGACAATDSLRRRFPDGYWTQRALAAAGTSACPESPPMGPVERDVADWLLEEFPAARTSPAARAAGIRASEPFRRARALAALGLREEAEAEIAGLRRTGESDPVALLALAEAAWTIGLPREGMRAAMLLKRRTSGDVLSGSLPAPVARLLYPIVHLDSVRRWATEHDLDPLFLCAVAREESWFDPSAVSRAGARGLMQIMPATGFDLAGRADVRGFAAGDLFDPEVNVRLGARYLRELLDELDREPVLALAAYNAGVANAIRWRTERGGAFDVDRYVTGITYRETNGYVQKVMRTWAIYRALWGGILEDLPAAGGPAHGR